MVHKVQDKWGGPSRDIKLADVVDHIKARRDDIRREEMIQFVKQHPDLGLTSMIVGIWTHTTSTETESEMFEKKGFSYIAIACFVGTTVAQVEGLGFRV